MDVYIVTKAEFMGPDLYDSVFASKKAAEKHIRSSYPNAREDCVDDKHWNYLCKVGNHWFLMFITKESVQS